MGTEIARQISSRIPHLDHTTSGIIEGCLSGSVCDGSTDYKIALINPPTTTERTRLMARHNELMQALRDHDKKEIGALIAEMLGSYDVARQKYKTNKIRMEAVAKYVQELKGVPTWAVQAACDKIRMGTAPDISHVYEPTTIQVRVLAVSIAQPFKTEAQTIGNILIAPKYQQPVNEEVRAKVGALLAKLADQMKAKRDQEREEAIAKDAPRIKEQTNSMIEAEYRGRGLDPVRANNGMLISRSLLDQIKSRE